MKRPKLKSLYIAVEPVGSLFARTLQRVIKQRVNNKVWRITHQIGDRYQRLGRSLFRVTKEPLNKIEQLNLFKRHEVSHPPFTTNVAEVDKLGSKVVFARKLINSTNGRGIVEFDVQETVRPPVAPLYTAYIPKKAEYRVHVFGKAVVDVQQKKKKRDFANERDTRVRNLRNGYVYVRNDINPPIGVHNLAIAAVNALGYNYGAVDIIYNEKQDKLYVLEVNSRPGLMGTTVENYGNALINHFNLRRK